MRALSVLCLAHLAGVGCGDRSLSPGGAAESAASTSTERAYNFSTIGKVTLVDRGPRCATLSVDGVISFNNCFDVDRLPVAVYFDNANGLMLLAVDSGDLVSFADRGVREFSSSEHYVAAQLSSGMSLDDLRFTVVSPERVRTCFIKFNAFMHCR
ncbi:MAG: hypothetical protein M3P52_07890 [Actinomycetota bacterium]|nr:hypothetical protein [Actinomycetota bacterium]